MRKLKEFKKSDNTLLSRSQLQNLVGGLLRSRDRCSFDTCNNNCSDTSTTWTVDENGKIISSYTEVSYQNKDC
jgi:hypothetical protein